MTKTLLLFSLLGWKKLLVKIYHHHRQLEDHQPLAVLMNLPLLFHFWSFCICIWHGSYSEWVPSLLSSLITCLFLSPESLNELRTPTNASEFRIDLDSVTMSKNALRTCYELVTDVLNREFVAKFSNRLKLWPRIPD